MHILLANQWYPPHTGFGGVAAYNYYLAHALVEQGHKVTVVAARWTKDVPESQEDAGVQVIRLLKTHRARLCRIPLIGRYVREVEQYLYSRRVAKKICELNELHPVDLVEFAEVNAEGYHTLKQRNRLPVVVRCHTPSFVLKRHYRQDETNYDMSLTEKMEKYCIQAADLITAPSRDMAEVISGHFTGKLDPIHVVTNPLDLDLFKPKENLDQPDRLKILHVGRMERVKGIEVLIQTVPLVLKAFPLAQFIFVGGSSANYLQAIKAQLSSSGVKKDQVLFEGAVGQDQLIALYQDADIAVVPTLNYESFSYTCAQALACGVPLVASQIGGIPETVGANNSAVLVEPGNVQALAEAIINLCQNPGMRQAMGKAGRIQAEEYFSDGVVVKQMLNLYDSLKTKKP